MSGISSLRGRVRGPAQRPNQRLALAVAVVLGLTAGLLVGPGAATVFATTPSAANTAVSVGTVKAGTVKVGAVTMTRCHIVDEPVWCGSVRVPLDRTDPQSPLISIGFGWVPSTGTATGTIVTMEGGPGYPSTGTAPDFLDMIGGLHSTRNLLIVDSRGTGTSALIRCKALQAFTGSTASQAFRTLVAGCGDQLNHTYQRSDKSYVQASDLFGTANSARDLADVIGALGVGKVDLYGDSYGTYFSQTFLARYPQLVRSVTLDSAYEARDLDPWYLTTVSTARTAFEAACTRSLACDASAGAGAWARIGKLAKALRQHPIHGKVPGTAAKATPTTVGIRQLVDLVNDAGYDYAVYRSLDAAARAYLNHGVKRPLLRLYAEDWGYDDSDYYGPARSYSDGLFYAVACTDYPQLFSMTSTPAARRGELATSVAALPAKTFAPFTTAEWVSMDQYTEAYTACLDWPAPTHAADPPIPDNLSMDSANVPVLILNGDLDSLTPAAGGAHVAEQIGSPARAVLTANMVHLSALDDRYGCGESIYRQFVRKPSALHTMDASCAKKIPEVHTLGAFPKTIKHAKKAAVVAGHSTAQDRRLATALVAEVGDAIYRYQYVDDVDDLGLHGGRVHYTTPGNGDVVLAHLQAARWTTDTKVSGTVRSDYYGLGADGTVTITGPHGHRLTATVSWSTTGRHTMAKVKTAHATYHVPAT